MNKLKFKNQNISAVETEKLEDEIERRKVDLLFPLEIFSDQAPFISQLEAIGCDRNAIGASMLATIATAIGAGAQFNIEQTKWSKFPNIWMLVVGRSGSGKSKADGFILSPLKDIDNEIFENTKDSEFPRSIISQESKLVTFKQVVLQNNPKGIIKYGDELREWIETMENDRETGFWLESFSNNIIKVTRKNKTYNLPNHCCTVYGGTQPCFIDYYFRHKKDKDGFSARLLFSHLTKDEFVYPNYNSEVAQSTIDQWKKKIDVIYNNFPRMCWEDSARKINVDPSILKHHEAWVRNEHKKISAMAKNVIEIYEAALTKMQEYIWKFALILKIYEQSEGNLAQKFVIDMPALEKAFKLGSYFMSSYILAYQMYRENSCPEEIKMIANMLRNGATKSQIAKFLGKDQSNFNKKINEWKKEWPLIFM
jgi:hypothetical protein